LSEGELRSVFPLIPDESGDDDSGGGSGGRGRRKSREEAKADQKQSFIEPVKDG